MEYKNQQKSIEAIIDSLTDQTDFEIFMFLIIHNELSLSELTELIDKSKPTIHRHLQTLMDIGLVAESKEELVRGNIPAKYYQAIPSNLHEIPRISPNEVEKYSDQQRLNLFYKIQGMISTTTTFANTSINNFIDYLSEIENKKESVDSLLKQPDLLINLNFLSKEQFMQWQPIYRNYMKDFIDMLKRTEISSPNAEKPYVFFTSVLPFHKIFHAELNADESEKIIAHPTDGSNQKEEKPERPKKYEKKSKLTELEDNSLQNIQKLLEEAEISDLNQRYQQLNGHVVNLDISRLNLYEIPDDIFNFKKLVELNISQNNIEELPDKIGKLSGLKVLEAQKNEIKILPKVISKLTNLEILDLSDNLIDDIPEFVEELKNLRLFYV